MTFASRRFWGVRPVHVAMLVAALGLVVSAMIRQNEVPVTLYSGYLLGAVLWLAGSMIASRVVVTRYGIVRGMTGSGNRIAWAQVNDGFDVERRGGRAFVFLYTDDRMLQRRFEVFVPSVKTDAFAGVVQQHLLSSRDAQLFPAIGRRAVED